MNTPTFAPPASRCLKCFCRQSAPQKRRSLPTETIARWESPFKVVKATKFAAPQARNLRRSRAARQRIFTLRSEQFARSAQFQLCEAHNCASAHHFNCAKRIISALAHHFHCGLPHHCAQRTISALAHHFHCGLPHHCASAHHFNCAQRIISGASRVIFLPAQRIISALARHFHCGLPHHCASAHHSNCAQRIISGVSRVFSHQLTCGA